MVLYTGTCRNSGVAKLGCSDRYAGSGKETKLTQVEQIMDIERYFAAFPALEKPSVSNGLNGAATSAYAPAPDSPVRPPPTQPAQEIRKSISSAAGRASPVRGGLTRKGNHNGFAGKSSVTQNGNGKRYGTPSRNGTNNHHRRPASPSQYQSQPGKRPQNVNQRKKWKRMTYLATKPWKHLPDIKESKTPRPPAPAKTAKSVKEELNDSSRSETDPWLDLPSGALEAILNAESPGCDDPCPSPPTEAADVWTAKPNDENDWPSSGEVEAGTSAVKATSSKATVDDAQADWLSIRYPSNEEADTELSKTWSDDYREIESQMSQLLLLSDGDDLDRSGSRLMKYFEPNPLSYAIRNSCYKSHGEAEPARPASLACRHCEQSYEVVLQSELPPTNAKPVYRSNLLSNVDSRLNFDWTKYHPPPWSPFSDETDDETARASNARSVSCDCEFCRSRIWSRVCPACATPL